MLRGVVDDQESFQETKKISYCIAMDNYFTLPKVMSMLRERDIGVFGTSRDFPTDSSKLNAYKRT